MGDLVFWYQHQAEYAPDGTGAIKTNPAMVFGDNLPYSVSDVTDYVVSSARH